jgi:hypothetical protein
MVRSWDWQRLEERHICSALIAFENGDDGHLKK